MPCLLTDQQKMNHVAARLEPLDYSNVQQIYLSVMKDLREAM